MSDTITVPSALLGQILDAMTTSINVSVAVQDICAASGDALTSGCIYAIEACIEKQETLICPAVEALRIAMGVAHG